MESPVQGSSAADDQPNQFVDSFQYRLQKETDDLDERDRLAARDGGEITSQCRPRNPHVGNPKLLSTYNVDWGSRPAGVFDTSDVSSPMDQLQLQRYRLYIAEQEREEKERLVAEKGDESDESAEWNMDKRDYRMALNTKKRWTKSRRIRESFTLSRGLVVGELESMEAAGFDVQWDEFDNPEFDNFSQCFYYIQPSRYISRFMDVCYPPLDQPFTVKITCLTDGVFYCTWDDIEKELHEFEEIVNNDSTGMIGGLSMWDTFPGDVLLFRAGSKDVVWKRGLVKEVYKRAECLDAYLVEYGMELVRVRKDDGRNMKDDYYASNPRGRTFFTCRFKVEGYSPCDRSAALISKLTGEKVRINCSHYDEKTSVGSMWISDGTSWISLTDVPLPDS